MRFSPRAFRLLAWAVLLVTVVADATAMAATGLNDFPRPFFVKIGNERTTAVDPLTHRKKVYLTSGAQEHYIFYLHTHPWADGRWILAESSRTRPHGTGEPGEHQFLAIDTRSGDIYWMATVPGGVSARISQARQFHGSYCPATGLLVFLDMSTTRLYALRMRDGKEVELATMPPGGSLIDSADVSPDGHDILYMASLRGPAADATHTGRLYTVYHLGFNPETMAAVGQPQVVTSAPGIQGKTALGAPYMVLPVGHVQFRPGNPQDILLVHEVIGTSSDGAADLASTWHIKLDGSGLEPLVITPVHLWDTHPLFGASGRYVYFARKGGGIYRVGFDSKKVELLTPEGTGGANHLTIDDAEDRIVYDTNKGMDWQKLSVPVSPGTIGMLELPSKKTTVLSSVLWGRNHPRHPHPAISPDGTKVAWNEAVGEDKVRIVLMDIDAAR